MAEFFKYCPRCGSQNHNFKNQHRFECLDCNFIYYHNCAAAVMVIIRKGEKILFTIRNNDPGKGKLDFPGGFVDPKESAQDAAIRELKEELNLDINPNQLILLDTVPNDYEFRNILYRTLDVIYEIKLSDDISDNIKIQIEEIQAVKWLKKNEFSIDDIAFDSMKTVVSKYIL